MFVICPGIAMGLEAQNNTAWSHGCCAPVVHAGSSWVLFSGCLTRLRCANKLGLGTHPTLDRGSCRCHTHAIVGSICFPASWGSHVRWLYMANVMYICRYHHSLVDGSLDSARSDAISISSPNKHVLSMYELDKVKANPYNSN